MLTNKVHTEHIQEKNTNKLKKTASIYKTETPFIDKNKPLTDKLSVLKMRTNIEFCLIELRKESYFFSFA